MVDMENNDMAFQIQANFSKDQDTKPGAARRGILLGFSVAIRQLYMSGCFFVNERNMGRILVNVPLLRNPSHSCLQYIL